MEAIDSEACEFYYYFGVLGYVVMIVKFATTTKMKSFYDAIKLERPDIIQHTHTPAGALLVAD